jgi:pimeloyl-ACP methyl ester carboxylesterase
MQTLIASETSSQTSVKLATKSDASIHVNVLHAANARGDVLYVHGATFSSDLSVFYKFDQRSWADALVEAGFNAWGFDFVGYGRSSRYDIRSTFPRGRLTEALPQLAEVVNHIRRRNGGKKVFLIAHSWGTLVAARYVSDNPEHVSALVLFGPPVVRNENVGTAQTGNRSETSETSVTSVAPSHHLISAWAQYRRFVEDVPRGEPQVLSESHFEAWHPAWLATDATAKSRTPESVISPYGPIVDIEALWSGTSFFDAAKISMPLLLVRGEWDSVCDDADAARLLTKVIAIDKSDIKIPRATHLMHLESERTMLHNVVNTFLLRVTKDQ